MHNMNMSLVHGKGRWAIFLSYVPLLHKHYRLYPKNARFWQYYCNFQRPYCLYTILENNPILA